MKAYQNKITKAEFVAEMKRHQEADSFLRGSYSCLEEGDFRGCAVGCGIESLNRTKGLHLLNSDHEGLAEALGIPEWVAHFQDRIFENVSYERHKSWPVEFAEAIQEGTDLDEIKTPLKIFILEDALKIFGGIDDPWGCKKAAEKMINALQYGDAQKILEAKESAEAAWAAVPPVGLAEAAGEVAWITATVASAQWPAGVAWTEEEISYDRYADKFLELARGQKVRK